MAAIRVLACLGLLLALAIVRPISVGGQSNAITYTTADEKGLFYVFADGEILVLDPSVNAIVKSIPNPTIPFPNNCSGTPFAGSWADGVYANGNFFAAAYYKNATIGPQDAVYVIDAKSQTLVQRVPVQARPVHVYYVPFLGEVWTHSDGTADFDVIDAYNYTYVYENVIAHANISGHGKLLFDYELGSKGYASDVNQPGVFILDISDLVPESGLDYISFANVSLPDGQTTVCPGTHSLAYSQINRHAYFECISYKNASNSSQTIYPGAIEVDTTNDTIVQQLPYNGHLAITPDDQFLTITPQDAPPLSVTIIQITPAGQLDRYFAVPLNDTPGEGTPAFFPKGDYFVMAMALLNSPYMALIDFGAVIKCGVNCADPASLVKYSYIGNQNPPGAPASLTSSRTVDGGDFYICAAAVYDQGVGCYDIANDTSIFIGGPANPIRNAQRVYFAPGRLSGAPTTNVNGYYNCSTAPTKLGNYPTLAPVLNGTIGVNNP